MSVGRVSASLMSANLDFNVTKLVREFVLDFNQVCPTSVLMLLDQDKDLPLFARPAQEHSINPWHLDQC